MLDAIDPETRAMLAYHWEWWARPNQLLPQGHWNHWLILAGRGFGKTRTGAETVRRWVKTTDMVNLIGATADDIRDIMVEGESGILAVCPDEERPRYVKSERKLEWPNGATSLLFSAQEPDRLRGKQHKKIWCFIAGTQIAVPGGEVSIETLRPGDLVETRFGHRRVLAVSVRSAAIGRVRFSTGAELVGTGNHPVLTSDGWTTLEELQPCQTIYAGRLRATDTSGPISGRSTSAESAQSSTNIDGSGPRHAGLFRPVMTSIMSMATRLTTGLKIWSASATALIDAITRRGIPGLVQSPAFSSGSAMIAEPRSQAGTVAAYAYARRVVSGEPRTLERQSGHAAVADNRSCPGVEIIVASVASTWEPAGEAPVYDLTVEGAHEFIASGIVVHNCDEMAAWAYEESWDQAKFGLRLGAHPQSIITTTPKPIKNIRELLKEQNVVVTRGTSYENRENLATTFFDEIVKRYEGTRLGRQELNAEMLEDTPGALWTREMIRHIQPISVPQLQRIVIGIDPAISSQDSSNETGIVAEGVDSNQKGYTLADVSGILKPAEWGKRAIALFKELRADTIVAEINQGGEMVANVIHSIDPTIPVKTVHATRGKYIRAEPISAIYSRDGFVHVGMFEQLEDQMCTFTPDHDRTKNGSPDRLDAKVWASTELFPSLVAEIKIPKRREIIVR